MGRGRIGVINQSDKKIRRTHLSNPKENIIWATGLKETPNRHLTVGLTEEVLNQLRQLDPRDVVNILVNT